MLKRLRCFLDGHSWKIRRPFTWDGHTMVIWCCKCGKRPQATDSTEIAQADKGGLNHE